MQLYKIKPPTLLISLLVLAVFCFSGALAGSLQEEYTVKVALVFNFARFSEWPEQDLNDDEDVLRVVIYGDKGLESVFSSIEGMQVGERKIQIIMVENHENIPDCHLLFLAKTERDDWPQILAILQDKAVLTVGEMNGFIESGGIMNFTLDNNKIGFEVNLDQARKKNIVISSRILKLATSVIQDKEAKK